MTFADLARPLLRSRASQESLVGVTNFGEVLAVTIGRGPQGVLLVASTDVEDIRRRVEEAGLAVDVVDVDALDAAGAAWTGDEGWAVRRSSGSDAVSSEVRSLISWGQPELEIVTHHPSAPERRVVALPGDRRASVTVGRLGGGADIEIDDRHISAEHARFVRDTAGWRVIDCASRHGTQVNGTALSSEAALRHRDEVRLGKTIIRFVSYDDEVWELFAEDGDAAGPDGSSAGGDLPRSPTPARSPGRRGSAAWVLALTVLALCTLAALVFVGLQEISGSGR